MNPQKVKLSKAEADTIKKLDSRKAAIDVFIKTIMSQGENRISELQQESMEVWRKLDKAHNLDLDHIQYNMDTDGLTLVPTAIKL